MMIMVYRASLSLLSLILAMHLAISTPSAADCPLKFSGANFTLVATLCSDNNKREKCCRYINAVVAIANAQYANTTGDLGVAGDVSDICLVSLTQTLELYGVPRNATVLCGLGKKIPVNFECKGRSSVTQMLQSPGFSDVTTNCILPLFATSDCKKCIKAAMLYLRDVVGTETNLTLSTCRDATFSALASQYDDGSATEIARCFFSVRELNTPPALEPPQSSLTPQRSPSPPLLGIPSQLTPVLPINTYHHPYHLTLVPAVGIAVSVVAILLLVVLTILIHRKRKELEDLEVFDKISSNTFPHWTMRKIQDAPMFREFSYKEIKKATDSFSSITGQGGFGTVYKAQFSNGLMLAVKRMDKISEQGEEEFCREIELLAKLHHRHLVALKGYCVEKSKRFLMYEYMNNGSLKDHLHSAERSPLSWQIRIHIAIDVANALEYLHFYCDPPLCHRDIKSSNVLLDDNFVAKVADFGLAHASKAGSICFEPVNTDVQGTPGYMDPEYMVTQEFSEKSDVYSYGVLLLEMVTARRAIEDHKNLVEWTQNFIISDSRLHELVDPRIRDSFDIDQLHTVMTVARWCTQKEGRARPSIKQVLRLLYESSDPMDSGLVQAMEDREYEESEGGGRTGKGKIHKNEQFFHSGDGRYLASSSSTTRSYCSRSFLLDNGSPQSPHNITSL